MDKCQGHVPTRCPSCDGGEVSIFYESADVPVQSSVLVDSPQAADDYPRGVIRLGFCSSCGFIQNAAFDRSLIDYSAPAEESQGFSPTFSGFARNLAQCLVDRYDLRGREVVEIGSGKGEFLYLLSELGRNFGTGVDPGYIAGRLRGEPAERLRFMTEWYSEDHLALPADLICCRHTLEHVQPVRDFVGMVHRAARQARKPVVFFEVPDTRRVLREGAFWDIYYEHCSYFSPGSLARLFRTCGFDILSLGKAYEDQYLLLEARAAEGADPRAAVPGSCTLGNQANEETLAELSQDVEHFVTTVAGLVDYWRDTLGDFARDGLRVALWGGGSKAVAFLTTLGVQDDVDCVVDINPYKQGLYLPGTRLEVVAPEVLSRRRPHVVIVMNPIYRDEIRQKLDGLGVEARLLTL